MIIQLDRIADEPFRWSEQCEIAPAAVADERLQGLGPIAWSGEVAPSSMGLRLQAQMAYEQTVACTRCLEPVAREVQHTFDLLIVRDAPAPTTGEVRLEAEELAQLPVEGDELDTTKLLEEQVALNLPMRVLCADECAGLCPRCGANRNNNPDCCPDRAVDPRWAALEQLKQESSDGA